MNVTELARQLKMTKEELFDNIQELGFDVGRRAIKVDDRVAEKITKAIQEKKSITQEEQVEFKEVKEEKAKVDSEKVKTIAIPQIITVKELATKMELPIARVISELIKNGIMSTMNENIDFETASIISEDLGFKVSLIKQEAEEQKQEEQKAKELEKILDQEKTGQVQERPPVVVVMGHIDHGKTKLLDAIRQTHIIDQESGGITQHIGAYQVEKNNKLITFIDTPGHEAFTAMRSRGANVADLAILVVAADDGIMPQTEEAIEIMEKANLPFIVAINKIDKPAADIDRVKQQLSELNLSPEDWGGQTICVPISAKKNQGIDDLLEMILLLTEMHKDDIVANTQRTAVGTIIESNIDKGEGATATALIQAGILRVSNLVTVGKVSGKIKAMRDYLGNKIEKAPPSTPVKILGLKGVPGVGDILQVITGTKELKKKIKASRHQQKEKVSSNKTGQKENSVSKEQQVNILIKADTLGSLEAIIESVNKIESEEIDINIIGKRLGNINTKDIHQAETSSALLLGFNIGFSPEVTEDMKGKVDVKTYEIIYELIDYIKDKIEEKLKPELVRKKIGEIKVLAIFSTKGNDSIIGGRVTEGEVTQDNKVKIIRENQTMGWGDILQLQCDKKNVPQATSGKECGLKVKSNFQIQEEDILEIYREEVVKKKLNNTTYTVRDKKGQS